VIGVMSDGVHIGAVETLGALSDGLARFADEANASLLALQRDIQRTREWLDGEVHEAQSRVRRREEDVDAAREALAECRESDDGDCDAEERDYDHAKARLAKAKDRLSEATSWLGRFENAVTEYEREARRLQDVAGTTTSRARSFLSRRQEDLAKYLGVSITTAERMARLAGTTHEKTGVPFDQEGYPDFSAWSVRDVQLPGRLTGNRVADAKEANRAAGFAKTPRGYTWHHHEDGATMQLVPSDVHRRTWHAGGAAVLD